MYIALVCPYDLRRPGGVKSHILGLGSTLAAMGHRVDVIAPGTAESAGSLALVSCGWAREVGFSGTRIDFTWAPWRRIREVIARGYDVMHFHTIWNPLVPLQLAAAYRGPRVATFHDVPGVETPRAAAAMMGPASALIGRFAQCRLIGVSPAVSACLSWPHEVIPNGILPPASLPREGARRAVLYVGRLEPRKDVATLLYAAAILGESAPPLWIAGGGPLAGDLRSLARRLGLRDVTFFGEVDETAKWRLLRGAATMVAPSIAGESFGIVLLEGMLAGAVPIAADNRGYSAVLAARAGELLFPGGDAAALAQRIAALHGDRARLECLRAWGDAEWRRYDWSRLAGRVVAIYEEAAAASWRARNAAIGLPAPAVRDGGALGLLAVPPKGSLQAPRNQKASVT